MASDLTPPFCESHLAQLGYHFFLGKKLRKKHVFMKFYDLFYCKNQKTTFL